MKIKSNHIMKKFFPLLLLFFVTQSSWAQVGTGVVLQTEDSHTFNPTTVDSISTFTLQVQNDVGVTQTVFLGGLDSPFSLDNLGPIELEAGESSDLTVSFLPNAVGTFSDTLEVIGSVFGTAELVLQGDGIQVALSWSPDTLSFNTTPIGQVDSQSVTVLNVGDGDAALDNFSFSNPAFSIDLVNSDTEIGEGQSGSLLFVFEPTGAGTFTETVTFETNDPNNPTVTLSLEAISVSEVSGAICDATWSASDSPFTLVGDIYIPVACTLTLEAGLTIEMGPYSLTVAGDLICEGTEESPVEVFGGTIKILDGEQTTLANLHQSQIDENLETVSTSLATEDYHLVYYNNFENSSQQYDFNCYDQYNNYNVTGSSTSYSSYGCYNFYRNSSSTWSLQENSGDYYLYWHSLNSGDAYLYLEDTPIAPADGFYDFSFTYESDRYERDCYMTIDVKKDGEWSTLYTSPTDIEYDSELTRFAKATAYFEAGENMEFRIKHLSGYSTSDEEDRYTYIDEVRIESSRQVVNEVKWDFGQNLSDFQSLENNEGNYGNESRVSLIDSSSTLKLYGKNSNISFNTTGWAVAPIIVPEDGWYYIELENELSQASDNTYNYWDYMSSDNGTWYKMVYNYPPYGVSYGPDTYDWRTETIRSVTYLTEGSRIDFRYYGYYYSTNGVTNAQAKNFRIYQLDEEPALSTTISTAPPVGISSNRNLSVENVHSPALTAEENVSHITISGSSFNSLVSANAEMDLEINQSTFAEIACAGGHLSLEGVAAQDLNMGIESGQVGADYHLVYYNNFENSSQQYDFNCYDQYNNYNVTGSSTSYSSYGCYNFYRNSSSTWSLQENSGDYYLYWHSLNSGDAYLYLEDTPIAPADGFYDFSFTYESDRYERDCYMTIDVKKDGEWSTLYTSPTDIEYDSELTRFAKATAYFEAGENMEFRIKHLSGYSTSDEEDRYTYIDEVRIESSRQVVNEVKWDFGQNLSDFQSLENNEGNYGNESRVSLIDSSSTLKLYGKNSNISFNTTGWAVAPIIVPEDGWYYIELENELSQASDNTYNYWDYMSSDNGTWYKMVYNYPPYGVSYGPDTYDWRTETIRSVTYLTEGSRIDFRYYGYYYSTNGVTNAQAKNFRIYQLDEEPEMVDVTVNQTDSNHSLSAENCEFNRLEGALNNLTVSLVSSSVINSSSSGLGLSGEACHLSLEHTVIQGNAGDGVVISGNGSTVEFNNTLVTDNDGFGLRTSSSGVYLNYVTIAGNSSGGWSASSNGPSFINNSIIANNGFGDFSVPGNTLTQFSYFNQLPQFAGESYHLQPYSPCVDAAMPWHTDEHMPYGIGGLRADMGAYGGPNNAGWGGSPAPSAAPNLTSILDSPQDQGNRVGLSFDASAFDDAIIPDNITHYAFWRHFDPTGQTIESVEVGNWELLDDMPAQGFSGYAYQAQTLGNTNAFGTFNSCYTVVAHTDDPNTYWYSNVMCGESVDNLAPVEPELGGMVLETGGVTVFWDTPQEADYAYTEITSDAGFMAEINSDTLTVDLTAEPGLTYTYTAVHYDVNGNGSEPSSVTLEVEAGIDVIGLHAGWNLISTDRAVDQNVGEVFAGLSEGNLQYVTGFEGGVQFYDPSGLSFLNTLSTLTPGHGYWVKVEADDMLEVSGTRLDEAYTPALLEGWNLVGYAAEDPAAPGDVFADLEAEGDLLYVTGFDQGVQVYDPNGLSFLNTLTEMRNGFGYWVKSAVATEGDVLAPLSDEMLPAAKPSPRYDVVNGTSTLGDHAGEFVDVLDGWGTVVARLPIVEGGHLMTTALFGDDPATGIVEGLAEGEVLHFAFRGSMANETLIFGGNMAHKTLALTFDKLEAGLSVFPNPAVDMTTVRVHAVEAGLATLEVTDVQGRVVLRQDLSLATGVQALTLDVDALEGGAYNVELHQGTTPLGTSRLVVLD